jgi:hypothetical protein
MKRLYTGYKIFFENPYVLRIEFPAKCSYAEAVMEFGRLHRRAYKLIEGTWGYSKVNAEEIRAFNMDDLFNADDPHTRYRGYLCFSDEEDALYFRLSISDKAQRVMLWPGDITFTIHEVIEETDES